jgi:hypothetical protein
MAYYLCQFGGVIGDSFPWSNRMVCQSSDSESAVSTLWDAAAVALWTETALKAFIPPDAILGYSSVSTASASFKQTTKTLVGHSTAGTSSSPSLPYHTCEIVTFRTAFSTRWGRGRWYFPCMATNALATDGGVISSAAQTALQAGMGAFFVALTSAVTPMILHRNGADGGVITPDSLSTITGGDIPTTFAVQRRRADKLVPTRVTFDV